MTKSNILTLISIPVIIVVLLNFDKMEPQPPTPEKVLEVANVTIAVMESDPLQLSITAEGSVSSAGWINPELEPFVYAAPPADGIYDFNFNAIPPDNASAQVITPIKANHIVNPIPDNLKGVRIHAAQGQQTQLLN